MFPCTPLVYSLGALCSFFIYILLFTDKKKKKFEKETVSINMKVIVTQVSLYTTLKGWKKRKKFQLS